jgi:hypothetical protein
MEIVYTIPKVHVENVKKNALLGLSQKMDMIS